MEMLRIIARVAYRNPGMAASGMFSQGGYRPQLAGNRLIGLPIPDTQRKNPRSVGKGRFVTLLIHS